MWTFTFTSLIALLGALLLAYVCSISIYRLYIGPLAKFPGPKLAAVSHWYEFYFDFFLNGQYTFEIARLHEKYGPIIRVNPAELAIHDPDFYGEVYVSEARRKTDNYDVFCKGIDFDGSHLLTTDHDLHRRRRKPLEPFFSRMGVTRLQPLLAKIVQKLEKRIRALEGTGTVIRLDHAFSAFSGDIIGGLCWEGQESFLDDPDFAPDWYNVIHMIVRSLPLMTAFPILVQIASYIPENILLWAFPIGQSFNKFKAVALHHVRKAKLENKEKSKANPQAVDPFRSNEQTSLFHYIVNSDMPESERSDERLAKEAQVLLGGGTASTARTLVFTSYYIMARAEIKIRLQEELREVMSEYPARVPSWAELERVSYLQALIKESLRLSYGVMHRLPRVFPDTPIRYKDWVIPPGVPVGMSAYMMHKDPIVFPRPSEYLPERWLENPTLQMQRNWVPFCRGSRACLGMNLAQAEMSLALAVLFRPGGPQMQLYETDESDVTQAHDFLIPLPKLTTRGVRVQL